MTAAAEALARDEAAVTLARDTRAQLGEVGALIGDVGKWGRNEIAGGMPAKHVAYLMIDACLLIAKAARGEPVTS